MKEFTIEVEEEKVEILKELADYYDIPLERMIQSLSNFIWKHANELLQEAKSYKGIH